MKTRSILVVNDDGIQAEGILRLAQAARPYGEVWVVAPDSQRSGMSHSIHYLNSVEVWRQDAFPADVRAFACSGTPVDCVRVGIKLMGRKPDVVLSGINNGYNIASDIQYSATVGAALEAAFWGIHAIALSQDSPQCPVTDKYLPQLLEEYIDKKLTDSQIWNINFPGCPLEACRGVMHGCTVSKDPFYADDYSAEELDPDHMRFRVIPGRNWQGSEGTDLFAICHQYVSVGIVNNVG